MRAIIILGANIKYCPYIAMYLNELEKLSYEIDLVYWDRFGLNEKADGQYRVFPYKKKLDNSVTPIKKIPGFLGFRKFAKSFLKRNDYSVVLIFDTQFAVLMSDIIRKKYKKRYIYDMRDLSYESIPWYKKRMNEVVDSSIATFVSSDGFRQFFKGQKNIYTVHNFKEKDEKFEAPNKMKKEVITISCWGILRDYEIYKEIVDQLGNDGRFLLKFYGPLIDDMQVLEKYVHDNKIPNVKFFGVYSETDRYHFAQTTDILLNVYLNVDKKTNPIMSNKYYDGVFFKIPQIVMKGSFMEKYVVENYLGISISEEDNIREKILNYYKELDMSKFVEACSKEKQRIIDEQNMSANCLYQHLSENAD